MASPALKDIGVVLDYFSSPVAIAPVLSVAAQGELFSLR